MKPFKPRAYEWLFGALLASLLVATMGLDHAWVQEARPTLVAHAPAASAAAPIVVAAAASRHVTR
jgi:hypothetical protein